MKLKIIQQLLISLVIPVFVFFYPVKKVFIEAYTFPRILAYIIIALLALHLLFLFLSRTSSATFSDNEESNKSFTPLLFYFFVVVTGFFIIQYLGFYLTSFLIYLAIVFFYRLQQSGQKIWVMLISAIVFIVLIYLIFSVLLKVQTPGIF